jgi:uncharacterized protein YfiM (DUF2279 family)
MISGFALLAIVAMQDGPLPGRDKVKHFLMSAFIQSVSFSVARVAAVDRPDAQIAAGAVTMSIGILKEVHDRRVGRPFSVGDLAFDAAGALAAAAILNGTRSGRLPEPAP